MVNANCGCDPNYEPGNDRILHTGNFYLYKGTPNLSISELEKIMQGSARYFQDIGFLFNEQKVIQGLEFPELSGLDVLLFFVDYSPSFCAAQFRPTSVQWVLMKSQVNGGEVPYDKRTLETNTGFVAFNDAVELHDRYLRESVNPNRPTYDSLIPDEKIKYFASIAAHESAHAFAALDIQVKKEFGKQLTNDDPRIAPHIMACPYLGTPKHFHTQNIERMRDFIAQVQEGKIKDILVKRDALVMNNGLYL